jgi:nitrile hydratase
MYVRGHVGSVERVCGKFPDPEKLAYGFDGLPERVLYRIRLRQSDLWPEYGSSRDCLEIEIYEHWLEATLGGGA